MKNEGIGNEVLGITMYKGNIRVLAYLCKKGNMRCLPYNIKKLTFSSNISFWYKIEKSS